MEVANQKGKTDKPIIGITIGDINGIGPEVIIKSLRDSRVMSHITPVFLAQPKCCHFIERC
jgi:4-hydroxy-L-threonine phosphate dehydrogenase PdxA